MRRPGLYEAVRCLVCGSEFVWTLKDNAAGCCRACGVAGQVVEVEFYLDQIQRERKERELWKRRQLEGPRCEICGRELTNPASIARGIGPECLARYGS